MTSTLRMLTVTGSDLEPWLKGVAELRIRVFREFPYLYDGSFEYERKYLETYTRARDSICVLALDGDRPVGASTGLPMADETVEFRQPLAEAGLNTEDVFYCAESVLLPEYRGQGLYPYFFKEREAHARSLGKHLSVFCGVQRPDAHPLRPAGYQPLDPVWRRLGYKPMPNTIARFRWKDIDRPQEDEKELLFYQKPL